MTMKRTTGKRILGVLLTLLMILPLGLPLAPTASAADVWDGTWDGSGFSNNHITSAKGFAQFINNAGTGTSYSGQTVYLDVDIDLKSIDFGNISGGKNVYYSRDNYFQGTFDGQGHTIYNFQMHNSDHRIGIFRSARNATFKNVNFENAFIDDNDNGNKKNGFAVVVGFGEGNITFENVHINSGTVYGYNYVGGLIGEYGANDTLRITNCSNAARIYADNERAGGLVGHSKGSVVANGCSNSGEIYAGYSDAGGIAGWIEDDESSFVNCSNTGKVSTDACAGGIVGYYGSKSQDKKMTLNGCSNTGYIESRAKVGGGIAGMLDTDATHSFENNVNRGDVYGKEDAGGIVGSNIGGGTWKNNKNYGSVRCDNDNAGGILGEVEDDVNKFYNCYNTGSVQGKNSVGGIFGYGQNANHEFYDCGNSGEVISTADCAGGIYGYGNESEPIIEQCWNIGTVKAYNDCGGILGRTYHHSYIRRCWNAGSIETYNHNENGAHGGIAGQTSDKSGSSNDNPNMTDCFNWGPVSGGRDDGGLIGKIKDGRTPYYITNSYNAGSVSGTRPFAIIAYGGNVGNNVYYKNNVGMGTTQGTGISENDLINSSGFSGNYCKNTWGVKIGSTTYYYPILNWYRNLFRFKLWFQDGDTGTNVYMDDVYNNAYYAPNVSRTGFTPGDWYNRDNNSQTIGNGAVVQLGVSWPTTELVIKQETNDITNIHTEDTYFNMQWTRNKYYLDMNAVLDGQYYWDNINFFTADVYVNGEQRADDVVDFYQEIYYEDTYELRDIKPAAGVTFVGMYEGSISGTMGDAAITISPEFKTQFTVTFKDVLGNTLKTETVLFGDDATAPTAPEYLQKANDAENHYHFLGTWDTAFTNVTSDLTVTANYETAAHAYGAQASDGDNTHSRVCANCGYTETNDHNWTWITDTFADCGNPGVKHEACSVCGATRSLNTVIDPTGEHSFTAATVTDAALVSAADCEHAAVYYYSCAVCGAVEGNDAHTFTDGDPLDHAWGEPTYEWSDDGHTVTATRVCTRDGEHVETETRTLGDGIVSAEKTPANCSVMGTTTYTATFTNLAFAQQTKDVQDIPTNNDHAYGEPTYVWSDDGHTCTATRVCARDGEHVETETVTLEHGITAAVKTQPDCSEKGWTTYTATFTNPAFLPQTKDVQDIPTNDVHDWNDPTYEWSDDGHSITATRTCKNGNHPETETLTLGDGITSAVKTPANCNVMGTTTYTATFTNPAFLPQTKDVQDIPTNDDHDFGEPTYEWSDDGHTITATRVCARNSAHVETETLTLDHGITSAVKTPANCNEKGWTTYTATFTNPAFKPQTKDVQDIPTNDVHDWNAPTYVWAEDYTTVTATRTCANGDHPETETVGTDYSVVTPAQCGAAGVGRYTAKPFANPAFTAQTNDVEIPALTHNWGEPTYTWAADDSTVTAKRVCANGDHPEEETVIPDRNVTVEPTCFGTGEAILTATFENPAFAAQTKTVTLPKSETHEWDTEHGTLLTRPTCTEPGVVEYRCRFNCGATKRETVEALGHDVMIDPAIEPTCTERGVTEGSHCLRCGRILVQQIVISNLGHDYGEWTTTAEPTCAAPGSEQRVCARCGYVDVRELPSPAHTWGEWEVTSEPGCETFGEAARVCAVCGTTETKPVAYSGHTWVKGAESTATCTEAGVWTYTCSACGATREEPAPALGHDWTEGDATTATCTEAGAVTYVCSRCGETRTEDSAALGHDWGEWEIVREATREEDGLARRACARCGETQERAVQYPVAKSRSVQFVASQGLSFSISLGAKEVSVTTQSAQVLKWYPDMPLHFTVKVSADFRGKGYTVFVNQKELAPDADGGFTLPAGSEYVIVSITPVLSEEPTPSGGGSASSGVCKLCGKNHNGSFWGRIVGFVHAIIWFFRNLFK